MIMKAEISMLGRKIGCIEFGILPTEDEYLNIPLGFIPDEHKEDLINAYYSEEGMIIYRDNPGGEPYFQMFSDCLTFNYEIKKIDGVFEAVLIMDYT